MNQMSLTTKSVGEIVRDQMRFFIPDYQRGYRWEDQQVEALLDDLEEFVQKGKGFYCLQPLVVVEAKEREWEVVDGQQRLTTLFLILQHLSSAMGSPFHIRYERHPESEDGLAGLLQVKLPDSNLASPDFYYIHKAKITIQRWLDVHPKHGLSGLGENDQPDVRFIWYELPEQDAIPAFSRLNAGKIRLTDTELIRALFLRSDVLPEVDQLRIALRWDQIERRLQEPEFWSFLTKREYAPENHIELLLSLTAESPGGGIGKERAIYDYFNAKLGSCKDVRLQKSSWQELENLFSLFDEWFAENDLFHLVGFLIENGAHLSDIISKAKESTKSEFRLFLKDQIKSKVLPDVEISKEKIQDHLERLAYGDERIKKLLLCLNLVTLVNDQTGTVRFSFHAYKKESWDIEHIRATASRAPEGKQELIDALTVIKTYVDERKVEDGFGEIRHELENYDKNNSGDSKLRSLYVKIIGQLEGAQEIEPRNDISNLTLLDASTNRGYGNSPFQVKRAWVLDLEHQAKYLLPSTRSIFTKAYSRMPKTLLSWTKKDAEDYLDAMTLSLFDFFKEAVGDANE
ncbi:MAG: DUF262 domain-containing protein [Gallionella sp.]|nr:DUF262 domain-containing protein [Gallionella sp.]MDD4947373.1 DUF262 domain-containing protein [Gallionella sp.]